MNLTTLRPTLLKLHRRIGVGFAPLFLLVALSGAVLAFKPLLNETEHRSDRSAPTHRLIAFLQRIDPLGLEVDALKIDPRSGHVEVRSANPELQGRYDLETAVLVSDETGERSFDLFGAAKRLHKELLIGVDLPVQIASYLMLFLIISAPLLSWPRLRNTLTGWHRGTGWLLLPLLLALPLTGVLMSLHLGQPELPRMSQPGTRLSLEQGLRRAVSAHPIEAVNMIRRFRGGTLLLSARHGENERLVIVTDQSAVPIDPRDNLIKTLHEGTWAGPWSGAINLLAALALCLLCCTGFLSWWRRRRRRSHPRMPAASSAETTA